MRELKVMTGVVLMVIMMIIGTWHAARESKVCPGQVVRPDSAWYYRARYDSLSSAMSTMLNAALEANKAHEQEIRNRPNQTQRFNEAFTRSANSDAAYAQFRSVLMRRPGRYEYFADSTGYVHAVDTVQ